MNTEVLVVGGGPVGLLLGVRLTQLGIDCVVLEARQRALGSRAIGIHPPSLAKLGALGLLGAFVREGVRIERAHAFSSRQKLGSVDLRRAGDRFGFVLSLPQERTQAILEHALGTRLLRGTRVLDLRPCDGGIAVAAERGEWRANWVVGCDGGRSVVAASLAATMTGRRSTASYLMGDFEDDSRFGDDAAIFLADDGLVESFPLPAARRRWVVEVAERFDEARAADIAAVVERRTGHRIRAETAGMSSAFGIQQLCASRLVGTRRVLAGDAAHLISPFGGQGMNVGWGDAWDLADCFERILRDGADSERELRGYARRRRRAARTAMRRAAFNGAVGRRGRYPRARNAAVAALLHVAPQRFLARLFTMQGLLARDSTYRGTRRLKAHGDAIAGLVGQPDARRQP